MNDKRVWSFILVGLAGCSSGNSPSNGGGGSGGATGSDVCTKIAQSDVQAILSQPITSLEDDSSVFSCVYRYGNQGGGLEIVFYPSDPDLTYYGTLKGSDDHAMSGVGDEAYWNQAVDGVTVPEVSAHKGAVTCVIQPPDPPDSAVKTTPASTPLGYGISEGDGAAFAALLGKVCNDVFAGL